MRLTFPIILITATLALSPFVCPTSAQSKRPVVSDIPARRPITISNPSFAEETAQVRNSEKRRNIGNFFTKLSEGREATICYIGGSLTAAESGRNSYRPQVTYWLRKNYPKNQIGEINAGVAGTGSLYGAMRARRDCIAFKPDLVFIEFASEDSGEDESAVKKAIEGLIRQLLIVPQPPEIILLFGGERNPAVIEWHETIAAHYAVPTINLETAASTGNPPADARENADKNQNPRADTIIQFLIAQSKMEASPIEKSLPLPLVSDEMNYGEFKAIAEIWHESGWRTLPAADRRLPAKLLYGGKAGSQIEYYFEGTVLGLSFLSGPDGGMIELLIDGKPAPAPLRKIDLYGPRRRFGTVILAGGLGPGEHKLTIRIADEKNPSSSGYAARLGYLIIGGQRPEKL